MNEWNIGRWLETDGGPFILIELPYADDWDGQGDYEAACGVADYAGRMDKDGRPVIILGDEPMAVRVVQKADAILIIRWHYAPDRAAVDQLLETDLTAGLTPIEEMTVGWESPRLVLFDSSYICHEAPAHLLLSPPGKLCTIKTYHYTRDDTSLILHTIRSSQ